MSDLHRAIELEIQDHSPALAPPLGQLRARKRRRDLRRGTSAAALCAAAVVAVTALGVPTLPGSGPEQFAAPGSGTPVGAPAHALPAPKERVSAAAFGSGGLADPPSSDTVPVVAQAPDDGALTLYQREDGRSCFALFVSDEFTGGSCDSQEPSSTLRTGGAGTWFWGTAPRGTASVRVTTVDGAVTTAPAYTGRQPDGPSFFLVHLQHEGYQSTDEALDADGRLIQRVGPGDQK